VIPYRAELPVKDYFDRLFRHGAWANQRALASLWDCPAAQVEGTPIMAHLLAAEHVWLSRLQRRDPALAVWPSLTLGECETLAAENGSGWTSYIGGLAAEGLRAEFEYRTSRGELFRNSVVDVLTQVVTHGGYHRGQIAKAVGRAGGVAAATDFILFVRLGGPAAG
jgi:uncharacterized damage-inducible protein DinB